MRDFSRASVSVSPSEYASWGEARSDLMVEMKRPLKAAMTAAVAAAGPGVHADKLRAEFDAEERQLEVQLDHTPLEMHLELEVAYNFLSK